MKGATKVGVLVVVFVGLLYGAYAILGRALFGSQTETYYARFADAGGISEGTKVQMAGVPVGTVTKVQAIQDSASLRTIGYATMSVDSKLAIPRGSVALVAGKLLSLGENPVEIVPPQKIAGYLAPGSELPGRRSGPLDDILPESKETVRELTATLKATRTLLEDQDLRKDIKKLLETSNATLEKFGQVAQQTQGLMQENRVLITGAIRNASLAMQDVREGTQLFTKILKDGKIEGRALAMLDQLNATSAKAADLVSSIDQFVNDQGFRQPLNRTMANAEKISDSGTRIAESTEKIAANGEVLSAKAIVIADKATEVADEAKKALQDIRNFFGKGPRPKALGISATMDVMRQTDPNYWRTDIELSAPIGEGKLHLGFWDAFESNKLTVQLGRQAGGDLYYRYGIFAAKPGIGVDYRITDKLHLRGDLFDINDPRFDLRARFELGKGLYGWAGFDRIFERNAPTVGIGFQK